jgi:hypothetical protein
MGLSQVTLNPQITVEIALGTPQGLSIFSLPQKAVQLIVQSHALLKQVIYEAK